MMREKHSSRQWLLAFMLASTMASFPAAEAREAMTIAGVSVPAVAQQSAGPLQLNGAGLRRKFMLKVYVASFYTAKPVRTFQEAASPKLARRLQLHFMRDVSGKEMSEVLVKAISATSTPSEVGAASLGIAKLGEMVSARKSLKAGDTFIIDWIPGEGTRLGINGQLESFVITEPEFNVTLLRVFLGQKPIDDDLKAELLGLADGP